ncbi:MAG: hypothetical protein R2718_02800 [Solirubrobacterales bacterium]
MPRHRLPAAAIAAAMALLPASAPAVKGDSVAYRGLTAQDRAIKLVADRAGRVKRGKFSAVTACGGRFKPFTGEFAFRAPLDRSRPGRFRDEGTSLDSDGTFTGRYRWDIKGKRKGKRGITGRFSVSIVFREDGRKYATCTAEDVAYSVKSGRHFG